MRVQVVSDLHFEFHRDAGASFVASLAPRGVDVLIVAGDLAVGEGIGPALALLCERYATAKVVYVHGNHEFYGSTREAVLALTRAACARHPNLVWLDGDVVHLEGVRFVGAPLWFGHPGPAEPLKFAMSDFRVIRDFESWVYAENARALAFFERELRTGDVAITHYLPAQASVADEWAGSPLNAFFVCDVETLLRERRPRLWVHGHTHSSVDVVVGATRIVANPFGYAGKEENPEFRFGALVELAPPGP